MAAAPTSIDLGHHRDLEGRSREVWVRRVLLCVLLVVPVLGLLDFFGQSPGSTTASSAAVTLNVQSPTRLRSGLLYQARFQIVPHQDIKNAILELDPSWLEGMTINTIEPSPSSEVSRHGRLVLYLGSISAGERWNQYLQFQVNPTTVGHRNGTVTLYDGRKRLLSLTRSATVFP
ncbi:MAG: hypothetical protein ACJ764_08815 [Solirubrobacteraceae bacterium]